MIEELRLFQATADYIMRFVCQSTVTTRARHPSGGRVRRRTARREFPEVFGALTDADVANGIRCSSTMPRITPPFAVPSSFVSTIPESGSVSLEHCGLLQGVLAGRGVEHEQHFVAARPERLLDVRPIFRSRPSTASSCEGARPCRRAPRRAFGLRALRPHRRSRSPDPRRSLPFTTSHPTRLPHASSCFDGGRAERVARREQHFLASTP